MEVKSYLIDNWGKPRPLNILFDTGAYITVIDSGTLLRAGYNIRNGRDVELDVVGRKGVPAKEILLKGIELGEDDSRISLGPVLVYATDMSDANTSAVLGLNVIREFETIIKFGNPTIIELSPTFDINTKIKFEEFDRMSSRFGLWSESQIIGTGTEKRNMP